MKRIDPNFKQQTLTEQENLEFIDELFNQLFDNDDITSDYDKIPDTRAT
jgi:hypothetical protein